MIFDLNYQARFTVDTELGPYADALWFTPSEYDALKATDLDALAQARADQWVFDIKNPIIREVTKNEMIEKVSTLDQNIAILLAEKAALETEIAKPLTVEVKGGK
jgi:hypothetical protein